MSVSDLVVGLAADYSQIELRMLAEMSGDPLLIKQFNAKPVPGKPWLTDVHCLIGHELTGKDPEVIKKDEDQRRDIKGFNFSLVYGVGKPAIYDHMKAEAAKNGQVLKVTKKQAEQFYDRFFGRYERVALFMEESRAITERSGIASTLFGFNREIRDDDERGTYWGNQAINTPIQGTAHTLVLIALALLHMKPKTYWLLRHTIRLEVHDALYWFVKLRHLPEAYNMAIKLLQQDVYDYVLQHFKIRLKVPLVAEAKAGFTLGSMVGYEGEPISEFLPVWRKKYYDVESNKKYNAELEPLIQTV